MSWRITFEIYGEKFSPKKINLNFDSQNEPDDIAVTGRFRGERYSYGSASYRVPRNIEQLLKFKHLADTFEPMLEELINAGAESWNIDIGRIYYAQCNEELGADEIMQIARLKCSLSYSAYAVDTQEEEIKGFS